MPSSRMPLAVAGLLVVTLATSSAQTDLDAFMKDVVARRDDNWKKLQQYILEEREELVLTGPGGLRMWGEQRDFSWYVRDGFFVRSPVKFNGAMIGESDRRKAEDEYLRRTRLRDGRPSTGSGQAGPGGGENAPRDSSGAGAIARPDNNDHDDASSTIAPTNVDGLIRQTRQPQFVSSSYFLRFKFDEGRYALAGREKFEGRDVLRIEYYPTKLFDGGRGGRGRGRGREPSEERRRQSSDIQRLMNKVSLVTLWVEPTSKQIVKFAFDNVDLEFLPGAWLLTIDKVTASMTMGQPFPGVWLPKAIDLRAAMTFAIGQFTFAQTVAYTDYREPTVGTKVIIPGAR